MRQLKNYLDAKKPMWNCKPCTCLTSNCWRESDTSCSCDGGEGGGGKPKITWDENYNWRQLTHGETVEFLFTVNPADAPINFSWGEGMDSVYIDSLGNGRYSINATMGNLERGVITTYIAVTYNSEEIDRINFTIIRPADSIYIDTSTPLELVPGQNKNVSLTANPSRGLVWLQAVSDDNNIAYLSSYYQDINMFGITGVNEGTTTIHLNHTVDPEIVYDLDVIVKAPINQVTWDDDNPIVIDLDNNIHTATKSFTYSPIDSPIDSVRLDVGSPFLFDSIETIKDSDGVGHIELTTYVPLQDSAWISSIVDGRVLSSFVGVTANSTAPSTQGVWRIETHDVPVGESRTFTFGYSPENANVNTIKIWTSNDNITLGTPTFDGNGHGTIDVIGNNVGYSECYIGNPYAGVNTTGVSVLDNITYIDDSQTQDLHITPGDIGINWFNYAPGELNPCLVLICNSGDDTICNAWISWDGGAGTGQIVVEGLSEGQTIVQFGNATAGWYTFNVDVSNLP